MIYYNSFLSMDELYEIEHILNMFDYELYNVLRNFINTKMIYNSTLSGAYVCDIFSNEELIRLEEVLENEYY